ncbi:MAG: 4Fe-4S dicluster domain-containing protein [Nitrospira sp.]|nr:4Fe-4S dicluster domain-containing protein [bacterium]MBL7050308.1 4Fe-4S dicluster domain-containing protein [Nitrospira sp.]
MRKLTRRELVKLASIIGAGVLVPDEVSAFGSIIDKIVKKASEGFSGTIGKGIETPPPVNGVRFGMVIDLGLCIGCRRCSYACKLENNIPDTINPPYIMVFETKYKPGHVMPGRDIGNLKIDSGLLYTKLRKDRMYMPVQCNHCDDPPCAKVCPTQATYKTTDGIVMMDYNKCIGCRYCMAACPYNARRFNWQEPVLLADRINPLVPVRTDGVVEKCTFCVHRTRRRGTTRCTEACPNKARVFGNLNDPDSDISKLLVSESYFRHKEGLNTGPNIFYLTRPKRKPMRWFKPVPINPKIRGLKS